MKFFEGKSREETFFQKSFLSGGGAGAKPPQSAISAKGCGENKSFPRIAFSKPCFEKAILREVTSGENFKNEFTFERERKSVKVFQK